MQSSRLLLLFLPLVVADPPFLFPHGYFDSNKLKPFDAIYLNLMAASNLEYGGTTLEELDGLDASRKIITRPNGLARTREEDDTALDREPVTDGKEGDEIQAKRGPSKKFLRRLRDDMGMNPFEEIATRAPPRAVIQFQQLRRQLKKSRKMTKNRSYRKRAKKLNRQRKTTETTTIPPTLIPTVSPKLRRLPNNPYGSLDISNPNIMPLPIPPEFV